MPLARLASAQASLEWSGFTFSRAPSPGGKPKKAGRSKPKGRKELSDFKKAMIRNVSDTIGPMAKEALDSIKPLAEKILAKSRVGLGTKKPNKGLITRISPKITPPAKKPGRPPKNR